MRRTLCVAVILLAAGILAGQSLEVTNPTKTSVWKIGERYNITWKSIGNVGPTVDVVLLKGNTKIKIKVGARNNGSYSWTIPASVQPGTYQIRVAVPSLGLKEQSPAFSIVAATAPPGGQIVAPKIPPSLQQLPPQTVQQQQMTFSDFMPRIKDFTPSRTSIKEGEILAISIHVENATQATVIEKAAGKSCILGLRGDTFQDKAWTMKPVRSGEIQLLAEKGTQKVDKSFTINVIPVPSKLPVLNRFKIIPEMAQPGEAASFDINYQNAASGKIYRVYGRTRHEVITLSRFPDFGGTVNFTPPRDTGKTTYEIELINKDGVFLGRAWQTVRPLMRIHYFRANARSFRSGDMIEFSYCFEGASEAVIKRIGDEKSRRTIDVCGGKRCEGKCSFPFRGPGTYKLIIMNAYDPVLPSPGVELTQIR
ncbi:MAG: GPI anchored serine-threonine rich family protein [Candidatus Aminicenantes bacterium]|nr:GPI anchored serine-threonine rich family protein [Candidatus Aminicenantes bacterium]